MEHLWVHTQLALHSQASGTSCWGPGMSCAGCERWCPSAGSAPVRYAAAHQGRRPGRFRAASDKRSGKMGLLAAMTPAAGDAVHHYQAYLQTIGSCAVSWSKLIQP